MATSVVRWGTHGWAYPVRLRWIRCALQARKEYRPSAQRLIRALALLGTGWQG